MLSSFHDHTASEPLEPCHPVTLACLAEVIGLVDCLLPKIYAPCHCPSRMLVMLPIGELVLVVQGPCAA